MNTEHIPHSESGNNQQAEAKRRRLMALLTRAKISDDARHDLVYAWTNGRTSSSRDLLPQELTDLVWKFENHFDAPAVDLYLEAERKRLRSIVLKIATETGIKEPNDFIKFNRFMMEYSILKKELHKYTLEELHPLVRQFRGIETNFKNSASHPGTKAWFASNGLPTITNN
jgi:hypothetical protein